MNHEVFIQSAPIEKPQKPYSVVIPDALHVDWAHTISDWTIKAYEKRLMLPKSPEDMLELFRKGHSLVLVDGNGKLLSHAGATFEYPDGSIEVGAVCTDEDQQKNGFAGKTVSALMEHLKELYSDRKIFALANDDSVSLFIKLGGTEMEPSKLHDNVWEACKGCKNKPPADSEGKFKCCDTPYDLTGFANRKPISGKVIFDSQTHANGTNDASHAKM